MSDPMEHYQSESRPEHTNATPTDDSSGAGRDGDRRSGPKSLSAASPSEMGTQSALGESPEPDRGRASWVTRLAPFVAISLGGLLGANARFLVGSLTAGSADPTLPWGTLLVNVTGCFLIGLYLTLTTERLTVLPTTRLFFVTGCLGSYTTFSTFSYETVVLIQRGTPIAAATYVAGSLILGCLSVVAGMVLPRVLYRVGDGLSIDHGTKSGDGR